MSDAYLELLELVNIIVRLRAPDGCPWDQKQTPESFKQYVLEEAHELYEALEADNIAHIREELGDLLFQIIFLANLYQEKKLFSLTEVINGINRKMIRRHPHVFGDVEFKNEQEFKRSWDKIKSMEKSGSDTTNDIFSSIPKSLPALRRAHRVSERAARYGFEWPETQVALHKLREEMVELEEAIKSGSKDAIVEESGDMLLTLVNLCRLNEITSEDSLRQSTDKFISRFKLLQKYIQDENKIFGDLTISELLERWDTIKSN